MGKKTQQSRSGVGIAPSEWRPSLWTRLAPPAETGVVLNRIDQSEQPARFTIRVHRIAVCIGFPPHRRSRIAHSDMPMWISFFGGYPGTKSSGLIEKKAHSLLAART